MSEAEYTLHEELASLTAELRELLEWERFSGATYVDAVAKAPMPQEAMEASQHGPAPQRAAPRADGLRPPSRPSLKPAKDIPPPPSESAALGEELEAILKTFYACKRCGESSGVHYVLNGIGPSQADVVLLGDVPDRNEKITGEPFVGRSGKLLNRMLEAIGLKRESVYMCNIADCGSAENIASETELNASRLIPLYQQLQQLKPKVIISFGRFEPLTLTESEEAMREFRQKVRSMHGIQVVSTYHPTYLLRNPKMKRASWEDLCKVREILRA